MVLDVLSILTLVALTIVLGYIGSIVFEKTKIPDVIWLMIFGIIVGPIFGLVDPETFLAASPLFSAIALIVILFDAGMQMDLLNTIKEFPRSILIAVLGIGTSVLLVGYLSQFIFNITLIEGILLGVIVGGTSSPIVINIVRKLRVKDEVQTLLSLESILTDPIIIVIAIALLNMMTVSTSVNIFGDITSAFSQGALAGLITGIVWALMLEKIRGSGYDYMLTMSIMLLMYVGVESVAGSGAIAALFFGLVLGNTRKLGRFFKLKLHTDNMMKKFHSEITFFIRSFFFVYLGLILSFNTVYLFGGIAISAILILLRLLIAEVSTYGMILTRSELNLVKIMSSRGLSAAVVAQLPFAYGLANSEIFLNVGFIVIFITIIYTTVATKLFFHPQKDLVVRKDLL